jgi:hypothetical protein
MHEQLVNTLAEAAHDGWMQGKLAQGITSRLSEWGEEFMVPYTALSERGKDIDRSAVRSVLAALDRAGYTVWPPVDVVAVAAVREVVVARGELAIKAAEAVVIPSDEARAIVRHCLDQLNRWQFVPLAQGGQAP